MRADTFWFDADDGARLFVHRFLPDEGRAPKAIVHVAHGMAEHGARYARVAEALTGAGFAVYADDHRGHGQTAKAPEDLGFFADQGGFSRVEADLVQLIAHEKKEHPGVPLALFGHSMGSFLAQAIALDHGSDLAGLVLSGSSGKPTLLANAGRLLARAERLRLGARGKSKVLHEMSFGAFNKPFAPARTPFDWLSRDPAEVDKYAADPLCGFVVTTSLWVDVLDAIADNADPDRQARLPKDLPVYVFAGSEDPVTERTKSLDQLLGAYRAAGLKSVTHRYYQGARHETLNETNRDEVTRDLVAWLDQHVASKSGAALSK
jgi:alpha-beta hydrolase superfamily lysophospholipase